tara:strand:- start:3173 stop:4135 length:963 start_codon:yes stop_codon:yes gene_type:complete
MREFQGFIKQESTPGTEESSIAATDAVHYQSFSFEPQGSPIQRNAVISAMDTVVANQPASLFYRGTLTQELKLSTGATTPPESSDILESFMTKTVASDVTYTLKDPNTEGSQKSCTIRKQCGPSGDGLEFISYGVMFGGMSLSSSFDSPLIMTSTWCGAYKKPADAGLITVAASNYDQGNPAIRLSSASGAFNLHSYDMIAHSFDIDLGLTANPRPSMSASTTTGYKVPCTIVRNGPVTGSVLIEAVDKTAFDVWSKHEAGTAADGTIKFSDGTRTLVINLRNIVFDVPADQGAGNPKLLRLPFTCHQSGANGAFDMVFS